MPSIRDILSRWCAPRAKPVRVSRRAEVSKERLEPVLSELVSLLIEEEGMKYHAYRCPTGYWSIAAGCRWHADGSAVKRGDFLSEDDAFALTRFHAARALAKTDKLIGAGAPDGHRIAWTSLLWNVGASAVANSRALARYKEGAMSKCRTEFLGFCKGGRPKKVIPGLLARRKREWRVMAEADD